MIFQFLIDFLFPKHCVGCGTTGSYFCEQCRPHLPLVPSLVCPGCLGPSLAGQVHHFCRPKSHLDGVVFSFKYEEIVKTAIKKIKYRGTFDLTNELVTLVLAKIDQAQFTDFILIPVPLHTSRFRERGFNQSEEIGKAVEKLWGNVLAQDILIREKKTRAQYTLTKKERKQNVKEAFIVVDAEKVKNCKILLLDDIFTTGATLQECARVLKKAGAVEVWGLTIAHGK